MIDIEYIFEKLFNYFNVNSIKELSEKLDVQPSTVSNWKQRSSISAVKKNVEKLESIMIFLVILIIFKTQPML